MPSIRGPAAAKEEREGEKKKLEIRRKDLASANMCPCVLHSEPDRVSEREARDDFFPVHASAVVAAGGAAIASDNMRRWKAGQRCVFSLALPLS